MLLAIVRTIKNESLHVIGLELAKIDGFVNSTSTLDKFNRQGEIILMFLTILLYFCTSILTLLYLVKYCSFRAQNKHTRSGLKPLFIHQVIAQKLSYFTK